MNRLIKVNGINNLQKLRAVHALSELGFILNVDKNDELKFELLIRKFNLKCQFGGDFSNTTEIATESIIKVDHSLPSTLILSVKKSLIFPKSIMLYLKGCWKEDRRIRFSFVGLLTKKRKLVLQMWLSRYYNKSVLLFDGGFYSKILDFLFYNGANENRSRYGKLLIQASNRGRVYPIKSWDQEYYELLLNSKFVVCPSGDFIWTYRFFEAILCGAIPIIEKSCDAYNGFTYYTMDEVHGSYIYSKEIIDSNYKLCFEMLSISIEEGDLIISELEKVRS